MKFLPLYFIFIYCSQIFKGGKISEEEGSVIVASNETKRVIKRPEAISCPRRRGQHKPNSEITKN